MLRVWDAPMARPTKDIDLLGRLENSLENGSAVVREVCTLEIEPDGLVFRPATVKSERIREAEDNELNQKLMLQLLTPPRARNLPAMPRTTG